MKKLKKYEAIFGSKQRIRLTDSTLEKEMYEALKSDENLENILQWQNTNQTQKWKKIL